MKSVLNQRDDILRSHLASFGTLDKDYWSFRGNAARAHAHAYFQYPAMMVPQMQGDLIRTALTADPDIRRVFDPFVGSGTSLTEAMMLGLDFVGHDVNPLAILLCRAKTAPFFFDALKRRTDQVVQQARCDVGRRIEARFPGWQKWFRRDVAIRLSRLRRAIIADDAKWARQFFWVALAETVRVSSNSRTSTFKLHVRASHERETRNIAPIETFERIVRRNVARFRQARDILHQRRLLNNGRYVGMTTIRLKDSLVNDSQSHECDLLVTSPPYGDNVTTIPYGQHSYLPLQWIDLRDIDDLADPSLLCSTHAIDARSLGGSRRVEETEKCELRRLSRTYSETLRKLKDERRDRVSRVTAFCRDLNRSIDPILNHLRSGSYMFWIVGNRNVGGMLIPLDRILTDFLSARGAKPVARIKRVIPSKRMAVRNDIAETMAREIVLILRKG